MFRVNLRWLGCLAAILILANAFAKDGAPPAAKGEAAKVAQAAWERLKSLEGKWIGVSTKGWTDTLTYRVVAAGSVLAEESFGAHPDETMYSMFHLDGDRLLMTHYCVARNQPRLQATSFADGTRMMEFTFLDITGVPSRDQGHMDKCVLTFVDEDHLKVQWTWYQDGKATPMEDIVQTRMK